MQALAAGCYAAIDDCIEQARRDRAVGAHSLALAGTFELQIGIAAERLAARPGLPDPSLEVGGAHAVELEMHAGEAGAAVVRGEAFVLARPVDDGMQLGLHGRHRVDLARQRRDVERIHHRGRGDAEAHWHVHRRGQFVHRGDAQLGIDEQPFPVEGDDLDVQRFDGCGRGACVQRAVGVERVRADPRDRAQGNDDQQRRRPDHQFELDRMVPLRLVRRVRVGRPVAPGEEQRQHDYRHDDEQHQQGRDDQQPRLLHGNIAGRVEHHRTATGQEAGGRKRQQGLHQDLCPWKKRCR